MNEANRQSVAELNAEMVRSSRMRRDDAQTYRLDLAFLAGLVHGTPGMHATKKAALCDRLWRLSSHLEDAIDGSAEREAAEFVSLSEPKAAVWTTEDQALLDAMKASDSQPF